MPVQLDSAPWASCHRARQPLSHPGIWCHQHLGGFSLFLYWKIKPEPCLSVRGGSAPQPHTPLCGRIPAQSCPVPHLVLSPAGGRAKPPALGFSQSRRSSLRCRCCPQIAKGEGAPVHPLVPPCVLAGGSPYPEQHLGGWAKGGRVGGQGWDPPDCSRAQNCSQGADRECSCWCVRVSLRAWFMPAAGPEPRHHEERVWLWAEARARAAQQCWEQRGKPWGAAEGDNPPESPSPHRGWKQAGAWDSLWFFGLWFGFFLLSFSPHPSTWTPHGLGPPSCLAPWLPYHHPASKMPAVPLPQGFS